MGYRVIVTFEGIDEVIGNLSATGEELQTNITEAMAQLSADTQDEWQAATPVRTGRLQAGDKASASGMSFTLANSVFYYSLRDKGHMTPRGWRTKHGYRPAKKRSHVAGAHMSDRAIGYIKGELMNRLGKAVSSI